MGVTTNAIALFKYIHILCIWRALHYALRLVHSVDVTSASFIIRIMWQTYASMLSCGIIAILLCTMHICTYAHMHGHGVATR